MTNLFCYIWIKS